jgi:glycine oxidase
MSNTAEAVIVGGGIAGCAVAYYLGKAGVKATLIERQGIASQASGYSAGGLNPLHGVPEPIGPLAMESFKLHLALWAELGERTGDAGQARLTSMVRVALDEAELPALRDMLARYTAVDGFEARWLEPEEIHRLEPRVTPQAVGGLYLYGNGVVDSQRYTTQLARAAAQLGATIRRGEVRGVQTAGRRVTAVRLADGLLWCDALVVAMGPWAQAAEAWLGCAIPVAPLKGEILRVTPPGPPLPHDILGPQVSLYSRAGGQVWCGATAEWRGFDTAPSESARRYLQREASQLMPAMAGAALVQHTACLRPMAPDGLPIIGRAPGWDNVFLATGGGKKGILLSTGMGAAIAELIAAGRTALSIAAASPARFAGTAL